ncbi:MAG: DUF3078 domain-containing protein, partial [Bacteroidales bacterium]|nr:DUF3078 domain-containing protein [Bacteroidales bacterium]
MNRSLFFILFFLNFSFFGYSQTIGHDTLSISIIESIPIDSISFDKAIEDTLKMLYSKDPVAIAKTRLENKAIEDTCLVDTINIEVLPDSSDISYSQFINQLSDSLFFYTPDTADLVIKNIEFLLNCDSLQVTDSAKQAIDILLKYYSSYDIDPVIMYLQNSLVKGFISSPTDSSSIDSSFISLNDSLVNAVNFILKSIPEDSIKLTFANSFNDSLYIGVRESESDSIRIKLYDKRGEFAVLWIKKTDKNVFNICLEDGISIEKPKQRAKVKQQIDAYIEVPGLKRIRKVNIIVPIWEFGSSADIRFNQGYISKSWAEGGENSMSALSILKFNLDYSYGKLRTWDSDVEYRLGYIKAGENSIRKNDDKFELNTKFGKTAFKKWYYSALLNFKSQILKGYDYPNDVIPVSGFLSPGYLVFSLGMDYKPNKKLTVLVSPLTSKFTIVADTINYDQTRFGVGDDELIRKEIGAYI